ncbi:MAG: proline--tRNA ligase [Thermoplasmata archaeon]|nr:proline--tRNA ligase [Thermoplasmata archaeon]
MRKEEEFNDWYNNIVEEAGLVDKRYPVKGMNVWLPYGWKAMRLIDALIRREMERTEHDEVCFPLLIPKTEFDKEAEHIAGFGAAVYWVTHAGNNELDVPLLLRPTSETAMYPMFSLWVRSHTDLPLKTFQLVNTFRYETKQTKAFIRMREIHFFEAHTCHVDFEDAERQIAEDLEIMKHFAKDLCIPYLLTKRPDWDKFAGAYYTVGLDTIMPTGRTLQLGSIHQYKTNFAVPYNITYENEGGEQVHAHQTTYGMSERLLGTVVGIHGDEKGIIFPPSIAPIQAVIVPILSKGNQEHVMEEARKLEEELKAEGIRVHLDDRDFRPGYKYNDWELRGVPLRLEIGMRDIEGGHVMAACRVQGKKILVKREGAGEQIKLIFQEQQEILWQKARSILEESIRTIEDYNQYEEGTIAKAGWCGEEECGHTIEDFTGAAILGTPVPEEETPEGTRCCVCGAHAPSWIYIAKTH